MNNVFDFSKLDEIEFDYEWERADYIRSQAVKQLTEYLRGQAAKAHDLPALPWPEVALAMALAEPAVIDYSGIKKNFDIVGRMPYWAQQELEWVQAELNGLQGTLELSDKEIRAIRCLAAAEMFKWALQPIVNEADRERIMGPTSDR